MTIIKNAAAYVLERLAGWLSDGARAMRTGGGGEEGGGGGKPK